MTAPFDPGAWLAAYEAAGGHVRLMHRMGRDEGFWLGMTLARNAAGRKLHSELNHPEGREDREAALADYIAATRGVEHMPANREGSE